MGLLTDFFVSAVAAAHLYGPMQVTDSSEADRYQASITRVQYKGLTGLEVSSLWALLDKVQLDLSRHSLDFIPAKEGDEFIVEQFPQRLVEQLAALNESSIPELAAQWSRVEEVRLSATELVPVLRDLKRLAMLALARKEGLFIFYA